MRREASLQNYRAKTLRVSFLNARRLLLKTEQHTLPACHTPPMKSAPVFATLALLALLPFESASAQQKGLETDKALMAPPARTILKPIKYIEYDLPNGLHVILHENHAVPVISTYVLYKVGSKNERPDRTGFAHFFEHLMFEGSENIPRGRIDKFISGAGGNLNASTSFDQTDYYFNLPANQLKLALWIESERLMHARIDEAGVETQRSVVKEEKRRGVDNQPYGTLFEELAKLVFKKTPYEWVPIGSFQYIDQAKIEEFRDFWKTYYVPNNATLAVAGDFNVEETKKLIADYFGPIPKGPAVPRPEIDWQFSVPGETKDVLKENTPLPATLHAWRAPVETDPDSYPLELLGNILSTGRSSRLYRRMVEKEQVAMEVEAFPYLLEKAGMLGVYVVGQQGIALEQLDKLITEEVERVKAEGVTEEEFQKARNNKEAEFASSFGTMSVRAKNLARYHVFYGDANLINTELDRYLAVQREDLQRVAKKYFTKEGTNILRYPVPKAAAAAEVHTPTK
ncbi:MAG: processing peptidase [Chthoniobacter sp.]|nr:processing peptidase [Chthoniobacter sp.]